MTTLLALIRRPDGGDAADAALAEAYGRTHLPIIATLPGLRGLRVRRVRRRLMGDDDFAIATEMDFDDWEATKAALGSEEMAAAGANLAQIAEGLTTLLVLQDTSDLAPEGWR